MGHLWQNSACAAWVLLVALVPSMLFAAPPTPADAHKVAAAASKRSESLSPPEVKKGFAGSFLSSRFATRNRDLRDAAKYLNETLKHEPNNISLLQESIRANVLAGDIDKAQALVRTLPEGTLSDPLIASLRMLEAFDKKDYSAAAVAIAEASNTGLFGLIKPVIHEWLAMAKTPNHTPDLTELMEKAGFFAPFLEYQMALMFDVQGNVGSARAAYEATTTDMAVTPYRVVEAFANFYVRQGQKKQAQDLFDAYAKANPDSSLLPDKLLALDTEGGLPPDALVKDARAGLAEIYFATASILFGEEATQDTFTFLRIALHLRQDFPPAQLMLANLYEQADDYSQAIAVYDTIAPGNVFYRRGQVRKALNLEAMGEISQAVKLLNRIAEDYPQDVSALITKGDILREQQKYSQAAASYSQAIARTPIPSNSDWPLYYARGICYERGGDWEKAERDFLRALELEPEQPDVLNYLAYSWLMMNKNIAKAREYLTIAVSARPDDAHIVDSMGWAHYLSGNFTKAVEYLERAVELTPEDPAVTDHLGDAYWRLGRQTEARFQWQRALQLKPDAALKTALEEKVKHGLSPFLPAQESKAKSHDHAAQEVTSPSSIE